MITKQEMFSRAVRGLKGQGFKKAMLYPTSLTCVFFDPKTKRRCAWGHVDPENTQGTTGSVSCLARSKVGVAGKLGPGNLTFARALVRCHDDAKGPQSMKKNLRELAKKYRLKGAPR